MNEKTIKKRLQRMERKAEGFAKRHAPLRLEGESKNEHDARVKRHRYVMERQVELVRDRIERLQAQYDSPGKE